MLAHLFFGGQTLTELVEYQIGIDRRDATYKTTSIHFMATAYVLAHPSETVRDCAGSKGQLFNLSGKNETGDRSLLQPHLPATKAAEQLEVFALATVEDRHGSSQAAAAITIMMVRAAALCRVSGI